MKRIALIVCLLLSILVVVQAQGSITIDRRATVPASCDPMGLTGPALVWKTSTTSDTCGTSKGLCECTAPDTWTYRTNVTNTGIGARTLAYFNAGSALTSLTLTNGQLPIGSTGANPAAATITGTANQVTVTNGAGSITLATPQNIGTGSTPTFAGLIITAANTATNVAAPSTPTSGKTATWTDSTDKNLKAKDDAGVVTVTVKPDSGTTSKAISAISTAGVVTLTTVDTLLSTTSSVDFNTATATTLYTCPAGKSCVVTKVVIRTASTSLTTASVSFGWNSASFNDVIANATHTELTGSTLYTILSPKVGAKLGAAADVFKVLANTQQGGAATVTIDVFGFAF
jgi:hypothetical protein